MRVRFGRMINPICANSCPTGADDAAILNDTMKSKSLLPVLALAWQFVASKQQDQGISVKAKVNAMTTKVKAHTAKCSYCSVQCWQLTELDFSVNQLLFFSFYYSYSYWLFLSYSYS